MVVVVVDGTVILMIKTIHHAWSWNNSDFGNDTFGNTAMDGLIHEFGHALTWLYRYIRFRNCQ